MAATLGTLALAVAVVVDAVQTRLAGSGPGRPAQERVFSANVMSVTAGQVMPVMTVFGEVRSRRTLELRSPRAGTVIWLAEGFEDGAAVTAGQLLVRLDPADAITTRDLAQSDLARAEAEEAEAARALALARDELAAAEVQAGLRAQALIRQEDLRTRGFGTDAAVETAALAASAEDQAVLSRRQALSQGESRVALAATATQRQRIILAEAERALADTEIYAEFSGRLNGVAVVAGGVVGANERLCEVIDPDALEVSFRLSTSQFGRLLDDAGALIAARITISLDVADTPIAAEGQLARVAAAVGVGQSGRLVYGALGEARGFRPGDFVTVRIEEPVLEDAIVLPATALGPQGSVLMLAADDRLEEVPVDLLRRQENSVILRAPALAGREVVSEQSPLLGAGIRIRPVRPQSALEAEDTPEALGLVVLTAERRAELVAWVEGNTRMPAEAKARVLAQLAQDSVPAQVIARLEQRMGG